MLERNPSTIVEVLQEQEKIRELSVRTISLLKRADMSMFLIETCKDKPEGGWDDMTGQILSRMDYPEQNLEEKKMK